MSGTSIIAQIFTSLRNKFNCWSVHEIMNSLGFTLTLKETRSIHDFMNIPKIEFIVNNKFLKYKIIFHLGIKTVLYLKYNRINGLVRV